jgi:hypothetical protein
MLTTGLRNSVNNLENRPRGNAFGAFFNGNRPEPDALNYSDDGETGIQMSYATIPPEQDPSLIQAARNIYEVYYTVHPEVTELPLGVAIDRTSYRGKLIFKQKPALLPKECFIPFSSIDAR